MSRTPIRPQSRARRIAGTLFGLTPPGRAAKLAKRVKRRRDSDRPRRFAVLGAGAAAIALAAAVLARRRKRDPDGSEAYSPPNEGAMNAEAMPAATANGAGSAAEDEEPAAQG